MLLPDKLTVTKRSFPDKIPSVTVPRYSYPKGEPIVNTVSPNLEFSLVPILAVSITSLLLIRTTAKSKYSSLPKTVPYISLSSLLIKTIFVAPDIT